MVLRNKIRSVNHILLLVLLVILASCKSTTSNDATLNSGEIAIVSVNGKTLYQDELDKALPEGLSSTDSAKAADSYIKMWINEELVYEKAKQNTADKEQINKLVEDYRQSLTVYSYQEQLLKEVLSKTITDNQLQSYYQQHSDNLKLDFCLVKGLFLKVPLSSPELDNLRKWYLSNSDASKEKIEKASIQNAVIYDYFYDKWVNIEEITVNMPNTISNPEQFLKSNNNFETSDSTYAYLLHIEEFALSGSNAPYEYAKAQIKDILLNQHRKEFLEKLETDLYQDALKKKNIKYYNKKND